MHARTEERAHTAPAVLLLLRLLLLRREPLPFRSAHNVPSAATRLRPQAARTDLGARFPPGGGVGSLRARSFFAQHLRGFLPEPHGHLCAAAAGGAAATGALGADGGAAAPAAAALGADGSGALG